MTVALAVIYVSIFIVGYFYGRENLRKQMKKNKTIHFKGVPDARTYCGCYTGECDCNKVKPSEK